MNAIPLKFAADINRKVLPDSTPPGTRFQYIDIGSVGGDGLIRLPEDQMTFEASPSRARRLASPGSTVVSTVRTYLRAIGYVDRQLARSAVFSTGFAVLEPGPEFEPRFFHYACRSEAFVDEVVARSVGVSYPAIAPSDLGSIEIPSPDMQTQRRIADFLDDQVARIDDIIRLRSELIGCVGDRRAAAVAAATLSGDWGFPVRKLGHSARIGNGSTPRRNESRYWFGGTVPWLNSSVVNRARVVSADQFVTDAALSECHLPMVPRGATLVGLTGQGRTRGMATILDFSATVNQHVAFLVPNLRIWNPEFLHWVLVGSYAKLRDLSDENGSTKGGLTCEQLKAYRVPVPPLKTQAELVPAISREAAAVEDAEAEMRAQVDLLQERKRSLITAAVTGEFDVSTASGRGVA